jgi:hypothetical protein
MRLGMVCGLAAVLVGAAGSLLGRVGCPKGILRHFSDRTLSMSFF